MRKVIIPILLTLTAVSAKAQIPVTDAAAIAQSAQEHIMEYAEMIEHTLNQIEQIEHQIEQITQMEDYLDRFGNPEEILGMAGLDKMYEMLVKEPFWKLEDEVLDGLDGAEIFEYDGRGVYTPIGDAIIFGDIEIPRDPEIYRGDAAVARQVKHYQTAYEEIWEERTMLKEAIAESAAELETAETDAEVQKLTALLNAQSAQLTALDNELYHASNALQARQAEAEAQREMEKTAVLEKQQAMWDDSIEKMKGGTATTESVLELQSQVDL